MKNLFFLFAILLLAGCKNPESYLTTKAVTKDTVSTTEIPAHVYGLILKSKPFKINGIECVWEQTDTLTDEGAMDLIKIRENSTNRVLVNHRDCCLKYGFDFNSRDHFLDVNFDGFEDFLIRSYGSMAMFEVTNIYLYDLKTKTFVYSDLSDNRIETDSVNRRLITGSFDRNQYESTEQTKTHYFDPSGKLKYTEVLREVSDTTTTVYRTYEKIVDGKVVEVKKDTVVNIEK